MQSHLTLKRHNCSVLKEIILSQRIRTGLRTGVWAVRLLLILSAPTWCQRVIHVNVTLFVLLIPRVCNPCSWSAFWHWHSIYSDTMRLKSYFRSLASSLGAAEKLWLCASCWCERGIRRRNITMATSPTWAAGSRKTTFTLAAHTDLLPSLSCQAKQSATSQHENGSTDDQGTGGSWQPGAAEACWSETNADRKGGRDNNR